jgi:hypothetical protein
MPALNVSLLIDLVVELILYKRLLVLRVIEQVRTCIRLILVKEGIGLGPRSVDILENLIIAYELVVRFTSGWILPYFRFTSG